MLFKQEHGAINASPLLFDPAEGCWLFSLDQVWCQTPVWHQTWWQLDFNPGESREPTGSGSGTLLPTACLPPLCKSNQMATTVCWAPWNVPLMGHLVLPLPWHLHTRVCLPCVCPAVCSCTGTTRVMRAPFTPEGKSTPVGVDSPSLPKYLPETAPTLSDFDKGARHPLIFYTFYFFKENVTYQNHSKQK